MQIGNFACNPAEKYYSFLATIRDRLPRDLLALQETVSLHDGHLREMELSPSKATLLLIVDGDNGTGGFRRFVLRYSGVSFFRSSADPDFGMGRSHGYGDWGYDEADMTESGAIVHRIFFSFPNSVWERTSGNSVSSANRGFFDGAK